MTLIFCLKNEFQQRCGHDGVAVAAKDDLRLLKQVSNKF
jgi:hypothetical protein